MLKKATVNIGERQKRRRREISVMDCAEDREAIIAAVHEVLSEDFKIVIYGMRDFFVKKLLNIPFY